MSFKNTCNYREKQSVWALYLMYIKIELNHATQIFQNHLSWANVLSRAICTCFIWMYIHFSGFVPVALLFSPFDLNLRIFLHNFCYNNHSPRHQNFCLIPVCGDSVFWGVEVALIDQYGAKGGRGADWAHFLISFLISYLGCCIFWCIHCVIFVFAPFRYYMTDHDNHLQHIPDLLLLNYTKTLLSKGMLQDTSD